jgi:hypothetical protein
VTLENSGWATLRCFGKTSDGRTRFAHSAPWHILMPEKPLHPSLEEINYLISRATTELERNRSVLRPEAISELEEALDAYLSIREKLP